MKGSCRRLNGLSFYFIYDVMNIMLNATTLSIGISLALVITVIYLIIQLRKRDSLIEKIQGELNEMRYECMQPDLISESTASEETAVSDTDVFAPLPEVIPPESEAVVDTAPPPIEST